MGLLAVKLNQTLFFEQHAVDNYDGANENSTRLYKMHKLAISGLLHFCYQQSQTIELLSGRLSSLAYCPSGQRMLATMRPNDMRETVRHEVHALSIKFATKKSDLQVHSLLALPSEEGKLYTSRQQLGFECGPFQVHLFMNTLDRLHSIGAYDAQHALR